MGTGGKHFLEVVHELMPHKVQDIEDEGTLGDPKSRTGTNHRPHRCIHQVEVNQRFYKVWQGK